MCRQNPGKGYKWCIVTVYAFRMTHEAVGWCVSTNQKTEIFIGSIHGKYGWNLPSSTMLRHVLTLPPPCEKHIFPAPAVKWNCTWFAFFSRPFFQPFIRQTFRKICMKLEGRQVETPLNMDPTCTDQTWSRSSRLYRKILLPDILLAHLPLST